MSTASALGATGTWPFMIQLLILGLKTALNRVELRTK